MRNGQWHHRLSPDPGFHFPLPTCHQPFHHQAKLLHRRRLNNAKQMSEQAMLLATSCAAVLQEDLPTWLSFMHFKRKTFLKCARMMILRCELTLCEFARAPKVGSGRSAEADEIKKTEIRTRSEPQPAPLGSMTQHDHLRLNARDMSRSF